jgi:lysozyme
MDVRKAAVLISAIAIAIPAEGLRQYAYYDPPGILTVCYGSTDNVTAHHKYSLNECRDRLTVDMTRAIDTVDRCAPGLPENVLAAFSDAVYNIGPKVACNSTAHAYLVAGNLKAACNQLTRWDKATVAGQAVSLPGLTARREKERQLCLTP